MHKVCKIGVDFSTAYCYTAYCYNGSDKIQGALGRKQKGAGSNDENKLQQFR